MLKLSESKRQANKGRCLFRLAVPDQTEASAQVVQSAENSQHADRLTILYLMKPTFAHSLFKAGQVTRD